MGRLNHGQRGGGSDGWLWVVEMALTMLLFGSLAGKGRLDGWRLRPALCRAAGGLPLGAGLDALYLGVRVTGIALELALPNVDPRLFAVTLYPALGAGIPTLVWHLAPRHRPTVAFGLASLRLGVGIGLDLWWLGVPVLPTRLLLHRGRAARRHRDTGCRLCPARTDGPAHQVARCGRVGRGAPASASRPRLTRSFDVTPATFSRTR